MVYFLQNYFAVLLMRSGAIDFFLQWASVWFSGWSQWILRALVMHCSLELLAACVLKGPWFCETFCSGYSGWIYVAWHPFVCLGGRDDAFACVASLWPRFTRNFAAEARVVSDLIIRFFEGLGDIHVLILIILCIFVLLKDIRWRIILIGALINWDPTRMLISISDRR